MSVSKKIFDIARPYWPRVLSGIVLGLMASGVTGGIAWLVKPALDIVFVEKKYDYLSYIPLGILVLFTLKGTLQFGQAYLMKSSGMKLVISMQNRLHRHLLFVPIRYFHQETSGVIMSRVLNDLKILSMLFSEFIKTLLVEIPTVIVLLGVAFYRKWDLTILSIIVVPLIGYSTRKFGKQVKKRRMQTQMKVASMVHRLSESISGIKVIKVFNKERYRDEKFIKENAGIYRQGMKVEKLKEGTRLLTDVIIGSAIALVLWYGGNQVRNGTMTTGDFASIIAAIYLMFSPIKKLGESYTVLQEIRVALERIESIFLVKTESSGTVNVTGVREGLQFADVSFAYPSNNVPVLKNINLFIRAGEVIAIVGPSGAGKTTFADLIPRFYDPSSGSISLDGTDIRQIELSSLRSLIGIVSQDIILFNDTVTENIAFGNENASIDEIKRAADMAHASEFIDKFPEGYNTSIGERGLKLSGGQRQRIAIARAILKNPPLLILDEATSSLDTVSETLVQKALEGLMKNRTTIVIAHRLSTIKNADRIIVLEDGAITDIGTHDELLSRGKTYARLCDGLML